MAKTVEPVLAEGPSPREVGRTLRQVRKQQGLSRTVVARSAGLTRRELAAYERGRVEVPESDLWCLAGSCGVEVGELLPAREPLRISGDLSAIGVGDTVRRLRPSGEPDGVVREYLAMIYELRNLPAGSRIPLRQPDLVALADALGGTPEAIERRLVELIGASPNEAARLRAMILPPLSLPAATAERGDPYAVLAQGGDVPPAVEDFFAAPAPVDPFAPAPAAPAAGVNPAVGSAAPAGFDPAPVAPAPIAFSTLTEGAPVAPAPTVMPAPAEGNLLPRVEATMTAAADPFTTAAPRSSDPFAGPVDPGATAAAAAADPFASPRGDDPLAPPPLPPDPFADSVTAPADPFTTAAPRPSDPFAGPVDPGATAAAAAADPFASPRGDDPLAPPPMPPDPFAVSTPVAAMNPDVTANPSGVGVDANAGGLPSDPFAAPTPGSNGFGPDPSGGFGVTVLDAIVVDDPLGDAPASVPRPIVDQPAPINGAALDVAPPAPVDRLAPDRSEPGPPDRSVAPIAWSAPTAAAAPATSGPATLPRFERASAQWEIGGIFPATAIADDGTLALRRADARWALTDLRAAGDFIIEAAVDFRAGAGFGLVFRGSIDGGERVSGYSFDLDPVASGGGYLVRLWDDSRQHWRPLAHTPITDPGQLYGHHVVRVTLRSDQLTVQVDDEPVLEIAALSRASVDAGREPCRGDRVGIQAWSTTEVTVESFRVATL
jgi:transcriptional regulator with XRE-family HTH domain